ncbi:hypothetical protein PQ460_00230 [Paenibacillus sp. KACC 21273]|uniref:hypothetical protein n=1 Tax=Paenibacillus sp. KACC 21273 TaxID=3025665 RepID=UPI0023670AF7|nr:hypothetical protein [Paenibacillus sp. KACC 21273]WDF50915.1 hypothetical protein PQ460_00230 [Paenibacillus sp. KACC 21273]
MNDKVSDINEFRAKKEQSAPINPKQKLLEKISITSELESLFKDLRTDKRKEKGYNGTT